MPSLRVLALIGHSDPHLFEHYLKQAGLTIVGIKDHDPLRKEMQVEAVYSIASGMTESVDDQLVMTPYQRKLRDLADDCGFLVGLTEGMDQMPGTWPNPIKAMMNADEEEEEAAPAGGDQAAPAAPPPPGGGTPPPPPPGGGTPPPM